MNKEQLIFLHIPKTAGSTLRNIVFAQYGETSVAPIYSNERYINLKKFSQLSAARKDQADAIIGHFGYGFHKRLSGNRPYQYATMLRKPIPRCLSLYNHLKNNQSHDSDLSFKEFLNTDYGSEFNNIQSRLISGWASSDLLDTAINNLERDFAFVGITERFNESLLLASHDLGWRLIPYERRNITSNLWGNNCAEELMNDKESTDLLMELNEIDMRLYEYVNQRFTEKLSKLYPDLQDRLAEFESIITAPQANMPNAVGSLGFLRKRRIIGWAKLLDSDTPAQVGITVNGGEELIVEAVIRREDLVHLHYTGGCGFVLDLPRSSWLKQGDEVSARVINAKNVSLQNSPRVFAKEVHLIGVRVENGN